MSTGDERFIPPVPAESGSYPLREGNAVRPLVDGVSAFTRICQAVEAARHSVWVTVAFHDGAFRMPEPFGTLIELLDRARARGVDVRALFWRSFELEDDEPDTHFAGSPAQMARLEAAGARFLARWDRLPKPLCHHQKSWLIDAATSGEVAFVGGINLDCGSLDVPGHAPREAGNVHDVYLELRGPAATDVHHNFAQRWNAATERALAGGAWPSVEAADDLAFPEALSAPAGEVAVQIARTLSPGYLSDATPAPQAHAYAVAEGEFGIEAQYVAAIDAAQEAIYIEDQLIASPLILGHLYGAMRRGVEVVFLVPGKPHPEFAEARGNEEHALAFAFFDRLADEDRFTLAGIASHAGPGQYCDVYVHAKIMLVDDAWATIGSANVAERSFRQDTEMNASLWHAPTVRALREQLLGEHLARDTSAMDARAALRCFREVAQANRERRARGEALEGLAFAISPAEYGLSV
ncbi:phospholipase D-like domain-containing protein [Haliangium ochraceum]|uniref:Phospholipase D/Transphosphatidylase n=1 Tax=Haliangium ochraceum (strain DSM 14365 / JCM 11303 / SMP-2) TaxID=502025 RepID=D0LJK2_HALO1|nr:phospholipase D-like domain-containing protein [Haliangium ochraceum]ACY16576.1 phospholipase D/Transphosphatidylase [Haliangium ochraceum DSM 14365]